MQTWLACNSLFGKVTHPLGLLHLSSHNRSFGSIKRHTWACNKSVTSLLQQQRALELRWYFHNTQWKHHFWKPLYRKTITFSWQFKIIRFFAHFNMLWCLTCKAVQSICRQRPGTLVVCSNPLHPAIHWATLVWQLCNEKMSNEEKDSNKQK